MSEEREILGRVLNHGGEENRVGSVQLKRWYVFSEQSEGLLGTTTEVPAVSTLAFIFPSRAMVSKLFAQPNHLGNLLKIQIPSLVWDIRFSRSKAGLRKWPTSRAAVWVALPLGCLPRRKHKLKASSSSFSLKPKLSEGLLARWLCSQYYFL